MKLKRPGLYQIILSILIILPYIGFFFVYDWYAKKSEQIGNANFIMVSKQEMQLSVFDYKGTELFKFPIACGENYGNKLEKGDKKTPEGIFRVSEIQNSENWTHDFGDGNGQVQGAFGPHFIRLYVPNHEGIGIHGTHDNNSMGKRVTEGCIRLKNEDLLKVVSIIHHGTIVVITASDSDLGKVFNDSIPQKDLTNLTPINKDEKQKTILE